MGVYLGAHKQSWYITCHLGQLASAFYCRSR